MGGIDIRKLRKKFFPVAGFFLLLLLVIFIYRTYISSPSVTVTVDYGQQTLPQDAELVIQLRDVSYQDASSILIAEQRLLSPGPGPIKFKIDYDKDDIKEENTYGVSAAIYNSERQLIFISDTAYEVITDGNPTKVNLNLVAIKKQTITPQPVTNPPNTLVLDTFIKGTINYDDDTPLPKDAKLTVQLRRISPQDASSILIAEQIITNPGQAPIKFRIDYDPSGITKANNYAVSAIIYDANDQPLFNHSAAYNPSEANQPDGIALDLSATKEETVPPVAEPGFFVTGVINYDNQINLPQGTEALIKFEKINKEPFAANIPIARETIVNPSQSPLQFKIAYDPADVSDNDLYLVLVRVYGPEGQTFLTNNFPDRALRSNNLKNLSIDLTVVNPPKDSTLTEELDASVTGNITYNRQAELPEDSKLIVQIRDTSLADASSDLIAEQIIINPGKSPVQFEVRYNTDKIKTRNLYSMSIRIEDPGGQLLFINDTVYEVITRGHPNKVRVPLISIRR